MPKSVLEKKFDPAGWQWEECGRAHQLEDLSREDLLQVACACIEALEQVDSIHATLGNLMLAWRSGTVTASPHVLPISRINAPKDCHGT